MLARSHGVAVVGLDGYVVEVEVSIVPGLPSFTIVGLPDISVQEARERLRSAVQNSGEPWPQQRITVNLSPAHLRKGGSGFDLAIAVAVVAANGRLDDKRLPRVVLLGELSLDGKVRRVRGILAATLAARMHGWRTVLVPRANAAEAALVEGVDVLPVDHLGDATAYLRGKSSIDSYRADSSPEREHDDELDLQDVRGQSVAKRALEVAAAGGHNVFMKGTPGGGKTMLARRLPTILPPMSHEEALEVTRIYSVAGLLGDGGGLVDRRPFRAPHHTISTTGLVGGGSGFPQPGEISLAHRGVLFLDEATEFRRDALESLRGPIEDGFVTIVRSRFAVTYPTRFQLIVAANPCPCGYANDPKRACTCAPGVLTAYKSRLSGPILDRIDIEVDVPRLNRGEIFAAPDGESSAVIRARVTSARERQRERLRGFGVRSNAEIPPRALEQACLATKAALADIERTVEEKVLTGRAAHRILRVARTIADLRGGESVELDDVAQAAHYRAR